MKANYYDDKLNSEKLFKVYDTNIPRAKQYLDEEIKYVKNRLTGSENVLELGAGYGRIIKELAPKCASITGIDISKGNVELGLEYLKDFPRANMMVMDVHNMNLDEEFDVVLCLQNGLFAMKANLDTIKSIMDLVKPGGKGYFSSYSENFWDIRLEWFQEQADKGLLGEIDTENTKDGVIVCKDGFRGITHSEEDFQKIGEELGFQFEIEEVDESSLFLIVSKE